MSGFADKASLALTAKLGELEGVGDWFLIDQERINAFGEVTEDRQFIHVDPLACAERSPFGVPIAHGFLTLSLVPKLLESAPGVEFAYDGMRSALNYGFDRVRFLAPVRVDSRIRASSTLTAAARKAPDAIDVTRSVAVSIDGTDKPALVAEWTIRLLFDA